MRRLFSFVVALIMVLCCSTAYAHSGRTDERGGHRDHSTGEYHYHHGYPAHHHWDMDGDGILDCPYLFDDKGGSNSKNNGVVSDTKGGNGTTGHWIFAILFCPLSWILLDYALSFFERILKKRKK